MRVALKMPVDTIRMPVAKIRTPVVYMNSPVGVSETPVVIIVPVVSSEPTGILITTGNLITMIHFSK